MFVDGWGNVRAQMYMKRRKGKRNVNSGRQANVNSSGQANGSLERYKARLAVRAYTQTYRIDYLETFALVAKVNTIQVLLSLAIKS